MRIKLFVFAVLASALAVTAALASESSVFDIAIGADANQNKPQPIWETIVKTDPNIFLFLGDNVYADTGNEDAMRAAYAKLAEQPGFQTLLQKGIPIMATWDDHDYGRNDAGAEYAQKEMSQRVFLDFWGESKDSKRRAQEGIYYAEIFGPHGEEVQIIALDTRYFMDKTTLLGDKQWQWLEAELQKPALLRIIMSSIQVIPTEHSGEKWGNVPFERERLFALIRKTKANGVIILSGDRHVAEFSAMNPGIGYPLYELTVGSLNAAPKDSQLIEEKNLHRQKVRSLQENFGLLTVDWGGWIRKPSVTLQILDLAGHTVLQKKIPLALLQQGMLPLK